MVNEAQKSKHQKQASSISHYAILCCPLGSAGGAVCMLAGAAGVKAGIAAGLLPGERLCGA